MAIPLDMINGNTNRSHYYVTHGFHSDLYAIDTLPNDSLEIQGTRVKPMIDHSFWSYYPGDASMLYKLAKGSVREDTQTQQTQIETGDVFSKRWHPIFSPQNHSRQGKRQKPPTSAPETRHPLIHFVEQRPTTAPVIIERPRALSKAVVIDTPVSPLKTFSEMTSKVPLRPPRLIDTSNNFDNLRNESFLSLTDGLKSVIFKSENNFVQQLCNGSDLLMNTSSYNDSLDDLDDKENQPLTDSSMSQTLQDLETSKIYDENANEDDLPILHRDIQTKLKKNQPVNNKNENSVHSTLKTDKNTKNEKTDIQEMNHGTWQRNKDGRIIAMTTTSDMRKSGKLERPSQQAPPSTVAEDQIIELEKRQVDEREKEMDLFSFDMPSIPSTCDLLYEFKSPFTEEYDVAIQTQSSMITEFNLNDFYRNVKIRLDNGTNAKMAFERCLKMSRLQSATIKWEQRRRQTLSLYNRMLKTATATDGGSLQNTNNSNALLNSSFSMSNSASNTKENKEISELKRELRCNECKRINCSGNCAPGQEYYLYKRVASSIPSQMKKDQQPPQTKCKQGCIVCNCRATTSEVINANQVINGGRLKSSKVTYSFGQKSHRPTDLRPKSMSQVTKDMKMKFQQANLSPINIVETDGMALKRSSLKQNGLLPGKSFRSQRRESLSVKQQ
ncbi:unnamed protein product [Didymodactylos carnosus]|uniref:Uncharacterized protein n=1 Tax=Didymodactylos carnosus TaxID=1234261 RepID=A0A8S2LCU0_9BILA|nr:unnamed protein product [Didymodactylos carnosus]CAF3896617.1 unnamed protein product [Didymodactylos carnosus]